MAITPESAEIMRILGMGAGELDVPVRYSMFEEVANYFGNDSAARQRILALLAKSSAKDGLEVVWRYVRLENEKREAIKSLNPKDFEPDIEGEIEQGFMSLANMQRVKDDLAKRKKEDHIAELKREEMKEGLQNAVGATALFDATKADEVLTVFERVEGINRALEFFK